MDDVKGLFFDVGGTVFDWKNTARHNIQQLADEKAIRSTLKRLPSHGAAKCSRSTPR